MDHFFCKEWTEGNFLIPSNKKYRLELLDRVQQAYESDRTRAPENAAAKKVLLARLLALRAYDSLPL